MYGPAFATVVTFFLCFMRFLVPTQGGVCWLSANRNGRCMEILSMNVSREECCGHSDEPTAAWSEEDLDNGKLFYIRVVGTGVACQSCRDSCTGVECDRDKKCVMRNGRPKCICAPCKAGSDNGPVCGTDGNSYENICLLKKQACRKQTRNLEVAHNGYCKNSCEQINCPNGEFCVVDQNMSPHCVECPECPPDPNPDPESQFCGSDGKTYNTCQLKYAACTAGRGIPIAYKGRCKETASCSTIECTDGRFCLIEPDTNQPRCVSCDLDCPKSLEQQRREFGGPICGTNNKTYHNWCQMKKESCDSGIVIETKSKGPCPGDESRRRVRSGRLYFS